MTTSYIQRLLVPSVASECANLCKNAVHDIGVALTQCTNSITEGCRYRFVTCVGLAEDQATTSNTTSQCTIAGETLADNAELHLAPCPFINDV